MSEKLKSGEHQNKFEELKDFEIKEHSKEALSEANHEKAIDSALKKVHESSKVDETERLKDSFDGEDDDSIKSVFVDNASKKSVKTAYMDNIRHRLSGNQKKFSKFVHNRSIENVSEVAGKTIIRPSGILAGSVVTLLGSIYYLYLTHNNNYEYNFYTATLLFLVGFALGLILEIVFNFFSKRTD
jgi:tetrahydromethanopterin S-methyltransferase subunit G